MTRTDEMVGKRLMREFRRASVRSTAASCYAETMKRDGHPHFFTDAEMRRAEHDAMRAAALVQDTYCTLMQWSATMNAKRHRAKQDEEVGA